MKKYDFKLSEPYLKKFFPEKRIKTKLEIIQLLLEATRFMLFNPTAKLADQDVKARLFLCIDKMSRLFLIKDKKYYSIVFPFVTYENEGAFRFSYYENEYVDSRLISQALAIISCDKFQEKCSLDFITPISSEEDYNENFWIFLREILLTEDGYIRYDHDEDGYNTALGNGYQHRHPLHHFDLFYTNKATFKLGLKAAITNDDFYDLLDVKTDCKYLTNY